MRQPAHRSARHAVRWRARVLLCLTGAAVGMMFFWAGAALAYWVTTDSSHPAAAAAATLPAPTAGAQNGTATPSAIPIKWTAPSGYTPTGYTILRCAGSSCTPATAIASGGCSGTIATTSCTDTDAGLSAGTAYSYAVQARLSNWVSPAGTTFQAATTAATRLVFTAQPAPGASIQAAGTGSFNVSVAVEDAGGNPAAHDNSTSVTLAINANPGGGVLACTNVGGLTLQVSSGVAAFTGCSITKTGTGYTLTASSSPSLAAPGNASSFSITPGTFTQYGVGAAAIATAGTQVTGVTLTAQDADGNTVTTYSASNQAITWSGPTASPNGTAPTLPGGTVSFSAGVSTTALSVTFTHAGSQTLKATDGSSRTGSATTSVSAGAFTQYGVGAAAIATAGTQVTGVTLTAQDADGNTVTTYSASNQAITWSGPTASPNGTAPTLPGGTVSFSAGVSTTALSVTFTHAGSQTLKATDGSSRAGSASTAVSAAGPASLALANCAVNGSSATCGSAFSLGNGGKVTADVQAFDQLGNAATITSTVTMSVTSGDTATYSVTAGATLTIDGTATPSNQSTTTFTVTKNGNASNSTTITIHVTSGPPLPDLKFTVQK